MSQTSGQEDRGLLLRPLDAAWFLHEGEQFLRLRDPLELSGRMLAIPGGVAPLLGLMDGTRSLEELARDFEQWTGLPLRLDQVREIVDDLDRALFLDNERYRDAIGAALTEWRTAPHRPMALTPGVYPAEADAVRDYFRDFGGPVRRGIPDLAPITGIISPHIDYARGGRTYAQVWGQAAAGVRAADLVVIFGTDHAGPPGLTLTEQSYATPFGVLPSPRELVQRLAAAIGPQQAFQYELHHRKEHSVELAAVWLHATRQGEPVEMLPVLCGSFAPYTNSGLDPERNEAFAAVTEILRAEMRRRHVVLVAAADLAHVGPAFGDPEPVSQSERAALMRADQRLLAACAQADYRGFFEGVRAVEDRNRICGLPPVYMTLRALGAARGDVLGYDQCPADAEFGSLVSIAGVVLRRPG